jgi:hypothetical protein
LISFTGFRYSAVHTILFNDDQILGVTEYPGHANHLHVRFSLADPCAQP